MKILTPKQYSELTGMNKTEVIKQCKMGNIPHFRTEGGYFKIQYYDENDKTKEMLIKENAELKQKLNSILSIIGGKTNEKIF